MLKERKNLRKVIAVAICLAGSVTMFAQETGVVINGVTWATRNVGAPGTFAASPESSGMFYQWNRPTAWATTGNVTGWDSSNPTGTTWETVNDPSPAGWHVPTKTDFDKLLDATKVDYLWTNVNGINGGRFTDKTTGNSIFLPAVGDRGDYYEGSLFGAGVTGYYWSSANIDSNNAYILSFRSDFAIFGAGYKVFGYSIRTVKDGSTGINEVSVDKENATVTGYFDILGRKLTEEPTKGIYIIQYDNGKTKKIMK